MRIGPLFKWFGSKWSAARRGVYPAPLHKRIIEPFAGGAGYSLNHCDRDVTIYDADPNLKRLWPWLIKHATSAVVLEIPVGLPTGTDIRSLGLTEGQALLLKHWQRTNNVGDCWATSPWGTKPGQWTVNTRARVAEELHAIKHWKFSQYDANDVDAVATWFIDPPYQHNYRYRKGLPDFDHHALGDVIRRMSWSAQIICCEAVGKDGAEPDYLPFQPSHKQVTSRRKASQSHHSRELVFVRQVAGYDF